MLYKSDCSICSISCIFLGFFLPPAAEHALSTMPRLPHAEVLAMSNAFAQTNRCKLRLLPGMESPSSKQVGLRLTDTLVFSVKPTNCEALRNNRGSLMDLMSCLPSTELHQSCRSANGHCWRRSTMRSIRCYYRHFSRSCKHHILVSRFRRCFQDFRH